jgi:hypothetical protein
MTKARTTANSVPVTWIIGLPRPESAINGRPALRCTRANTSAVTAAAPANDQHRDREIHAGAYVLPVARVSATAGNAVSSIFPLNARAKRIATRA